MVGFIAAVESQRPMLADAGSVAYAVGLAALMGSVAVRRPAQVRNSLIGVRGGLTIAAFTLVLVAAGLRRRASCLLRPRGRPATHRRPIRRLGGTGQGRGPLMTTG